MKISTNKQVREGQAIILEALGDVFRDYKFTQPLVPCATLKLQDHHSWREYEKIYTSESFKHKLQQLEEKRQLQKLIANYVENDKP